MDHVYLYLLFLSAFANSNPQQAINPNNGGVIGAIVDNTTRIGKEETVAMAMAIEDICNQTNACPALQVTTSQGEAAQAALAARHLVNDKEVKVILGPRSWEETASVAEVVNPQQSIPILSFSESSPSWATRRWPFLYQASPDKNRQMKAIAAIVESCRWRRVNVIYEDVDSATNGITPHLYDALQEIGARISNLIPLSPFADDASVLSQELQKLNRQQCKVFVVHVSHLPLGVRLFRIAKEMKMMEQGYVWITTDTITNLVHSLNSSTISTMQGVIGIKGYYQNEGIKHQDFQERFEEKFGLKYPQEKIHEPGSFAVEAYDATWTVALAMEKGKGDLEKLISRTNYNGLSGEIHFDEGKLPPVEVFQIINLVGRSHRELGFWSDGIGFFNNISKNEKGSMDTFGSIFWPGGPPQTPRGWEIPTLTNQLRFGVPSNSMMSRLVKVTYDPYSHNPSFSGFSIDVFRETVKQLPYFLPYNFIPYNGTYNELVERVRLKEFDAAIGDIAIVSHRFKNADFTLPHTESGVILVVPILSQSNRAWLFLKPFTKAMWFITISINTYNGFVVWMIERNHYPDLKGSALSQTRTFFWLAFGSLFSMQGEGLHSNLSRMATAVWLVVALIISQSYTASLTSMLTVPRLEPRVSDIGPLRDSNACIGFSRKSFVKNYLLDVLHFSENNIRNFSTIEDIAEALKSGKIAGAFLEVPTAKLLVAKYCKSFRTTGSMYRIGGYGYAFPKGSPLIADIDEALTKVFESGVLKKLEDALTASEKCVDNIDSNNNEILSLSPSSFYVLFAWTVGTSTAALALYAIHSKCRVDTVVMRALKRWGKKKRIFSRKVSYTETPINPQTSGSYFAIAA